MKLAVKVDVDTYRGTLDGVGKLCEIFKKHAVPACFLFSLGPDNTGRALRRIFRPGFLKKCLRSNVAGNYGLKTLMYGTILPAPKIGAKCAEQIREVAKEGFECGIHSWDHFTWQDFVRTMPKARIEEEFGKARAEFERLFGRAATCCGAPGWQISADALEVEDAANLLYASDVRGRSPFFPKMDGRTFRTLQIPSTLPTLDEVLGSVALGDVADIHFNAMAKCEYSVMTAHAELEGMAYAEWFDSFLAQAKARGTQFYSLAERAKDLLKDRGKIPVEEIEMCPFPGRSGLLAVQQ